MTTGKTIALTRWTFVSKVMSLLFSTLSTFVIAFLPMSKQLRYIKRGRGDFKPEWPCPAVSWSPGRGCARGPEQDDCGTRPLWLPSSLRPVLPASFSLPETVTSAPSGHRPEPQLPWPRGGASLPPSLWPGLPPSSCIRHRSLALRPGVGRTQRLKEGPVGSSCRPLREAAVRWWGRNWQAGPQSPLHWGGPRMGPLGSLWVFILPDVFWVSWCPALFWSYFRTARVLVLTAAPPRALGGSDALSAPCTCVVQRALCPGLCAGAAFPVLFCLRLSQVLLWLSCPGWPLSPQLSVHSGVTLFPVCFIPSGS